MSSPQHPDDAQPALFDAPAPPAAPPRTATPSAGTEQPALFEGPPETLSGTEASSWTSSPRVSFDLETTGRDPQQARIVTASAVLVSPAGEVLQQWEWLADPGVEIPAEAAAVHGVSTERARAEGRPVAEVTAELAQLLAGFWDRGTPVLAFNAAYDLTVLTRECERHGLPVPRPHPVLDPFVLNKQVHRYRRGKRTLGALCEEYGVVLDAAHTSAADALATERLASTMAERFAELRQPAAALHELQIRWAVEQAASLQEYFRRKDPAAVVDGTWPVHPLP
ncbi:3'-5' exonuclease [Kocuria sp.]|uniref:3'-5' exonuclease n=1 Tax=Kocuria sp. TaxID=1871328 RepID=UPI0026DBD0E0|nr:3'-5' exonuclease [Kocuria sp.]MDO4918887.1 3'-5' exonuclease [Kocuria sp.]